MKELKIELEEISTIERENNPYLQTSSRIITKSNYIFGEIVWKLYAVCVYLSSRQVSEN